jgi:hypothetical protein
MNNRLDRAELISLLESLGSENDEEVLAAARVLDTKVSAAGTSWSVLLAAGIGAGQDAAAANSNASEADDDALDAPPQDSAELTAQSLALVDKLLARAGHSADFRQELEDYKADIVAGEFTDGDHSYLRALYKRLSA